MFLHNVTYWLKPDLTPEEEEHREPEVPGHDAFQADPGHDAIRERLGGLWDKIVIYDVEG